MPPKVWAICGAPKDGCGGGRRRARLVYKPATGLPWCPCCGSEMRLAKNQKRVEKP